MRRDRCYALRGQCEEKKEIYNVRNENNIKLLKENTENEEKLIGEPAKRQAVTNAQDTIFAAKRLIGRSFAAETVKKDIGKVPFKIVKSQVDEA